MERINISEEGFCEIKVSGKLESHWAEWFDLMKIEIESDQTIISGFIADQSALLGLLEKICTLRLTVLSINYALRTEEKNHEIVD